MSCTPTLCGEFKILGSDSKKFICMELILIILLNECIAISLGHQFLIYCPKYVILLAFYCQFCYFQYENDMKLQELFICRSVLNITNLQEVPT
jgi:hypothetical protein